jgi:transcriptional regulator with XRE-family HTH domain
MHRIQRDRRLTPAEAEKLRLARADASQEIAAAIAVQRENPSGGHGSVEDVLQLQRLVASLRKERERHSLTLSEVANRARIDVALLEALEANRDSSPALSVLTRYARALGGQITLRFMTEDLTASQSSASDQSSASSAQVPLRGIVIEHDDAPLDHKRV